MTVANSNRVALVIGGARPFGAEIACALADEGYSVALSPAEVEDTLCLLVVNTPVEPRRIRFRDMSDELFSMPFEEQLYDFVAAVQFAATRMVAGGSVVQVASKAHLGTWDGVDIAAAGGACVAMARSMALELGRQGIRVNTLAADYPGEAWDGMDARRDVAASVVWLGSPASRLITGEAILLNQGRSLQMALATRR